MKRSGFSMIELVFVIVILGVLAAVAVPRFVATRTDAQIATTRSDIASAQKAIVAKVFADNIDATQSSAPDPNKKAANAAYDKPWGEWIMEVAGLDGGRWKTGGGANQPIQDMMRGIGATFNEANFVEPIGNVTNVTTGQKAGKGGCAAILGVIKGMMIFAPNNIGNTNSTSTNNSRGDFCEGLKASYQSSGGHGNKIIPLASGGTVEF